MQRVCVYPCYINSAKTGSEGRKLPVDKSVENPTTPEIYDVVQKIIKLPAEIEVRSIGFQY
jgi:signal recognition particle subunit SEC65